MEWQPIETAPRRRIVLFWGETYQLEDGKKNWKMETGSIQPWGEEGEDCYWGSSRLKEYDYFPTHWMPLPEPPNVSHKPDGE